MQNPTQKGLATGQLREHREARLAETQTCTNCLLFSSLHADVRDSCDDLRYSVSYPSLHDKRSSLMSCNK